MAGREADGCTPPEARPESRCTKYFTSIVTTPVDQHDRQGSFLDALGTLSDFQIFYGHFQTDRVVCRQCGHTYDDHHEKMTDVNIAVNLISDFFQNSADLAILVSGDGDLADLVRTALRLFPSKRIVVAFPPGRFSNDLRLATPLHTHIGRDLLAKSQLPEEIVRPDGYVLRRPAEWH